jgi:hypothetical protein
VLLVSKVFIIAGSCFYLGVELVSHGVLFYAFFLCFKVLAGIANGQWNSYKCFF